jgi:hypothetical protein
MVFSVLTMSYYLEHRSKAWMDLFALKARDCEKAAEGFIETYPRDLASFLKYLERVGC